MDAKETGDWRQGAQEKPWGFVFFCLTRLSTLTHRHAHTYSFLPLGLLVCFAPLCFHRENLGECSQGTPQGQKALSLSGRRKG